jgi:hypothetical protein
MFVISPIFVCSSSVGHRRAVLPSSTAPDAFSGVETGVFLGSLQPRSTHTLSRHFIHDDFSFSLQLLVVCVSMCGSCPHFHRATAPALLLLFPRIVTPHMDFKF